MPDRALGRLHTLSMRHGTPEQRERLNRLMGGTAPSRAYRPMENGLYLAEAVAVLFERLFAEQAQVKEMVRALMELEDKGTS